DAGIDARFVGTWRLVNWTLRAIDGKERPGPAGSGYLIHTDVNRMCAMLMDSHRPKWSAGPPTSVNDAIARNEGYISYCSAVELHGREGFVLHHVDVERSPNIIGTTRKRWFSFQGPDVLKLRVDATEVQAGVAESVMTFQRVR